MIDSVDIAVVRETLQSASERAADVMATLAPRYGTAMASEAPEWRHHADAFSDLVVEAVWAGADMAAVVVPLKTRIPQRTRDGWAKFPARERVGYPA